MNNTPETDIAEDIAPSLAPAPTFIKTPVQKMATKFLSDKVVKYHMIYGGSRSGKTTILVRSIVARAIKFPESSHLILRLHLAHVKQSIWNQTLPKVLRMCFPELKNGTHYTKNKQELTITFWNGSVIYLGGLDDKERAEKILGTEYVTIYFNECSQLGWEAIELAKTRIAQVVPGCTNRLYFDCNPPNKRHWTKKVFIDKVDPKTGRELPFKEMYGAILMNPEDNRANLGDMYIDNILGSMNERDQKRFKLGEWTDDAEGALFKYEYLARDRIPTGGITPAMLDSIVVAVDPAVSANPTSDWHGIMVVGYIRRLKKAYILEDASCQGSARKWALQVQRMYNKWEANTVVGEVNNGGDLVEVNLRTVDHFIPFAKVWASRGKAIRAEPVSTMSEKGDLHIVGEWSELEEEMTSWVPDSGDKSPNRLDAAVWGVSYFIKKKGSVKAW